LATVAGKCSRTSKYVQRLPGVIPFADAPQSRVLLEPLEQLPGERVSADRLGGEGAR
jgi:hypothetical protein